MFSIVAFKTLTFHKVLLRCGGIFSDSIITDVLLTQIVKFEDRPTFEYVKAYEVKAYKSMLVFGPPFMLQ